MNCPKCTSKPLQNVMSEEGFPLDFCSGCFGVWFDQGEIAQHFTLEQDIPNLTAALKTARKTGLVCPRCQGELEEIKYDENHDLMLDRCGKCQGMWFDLGETDKLAKLAREKESAQSRLARALRRLKEKNFKLI